MHIIHVIYHFLEAASFWDVTASFWFFILIVNREPDGVVFVSAIEKRLQNQYIKNVFACLFSIYNKFITSWTDKLKAKMYLDIII